MARYIDADALIKKIYPMGIGDGKYTINAKAVKLAIDNIPTADVVPRAEVEELKTIIADHKASEERLEELYSNAKAELAREIFEEIEELLKRTCEKGYCGSISDLLAELKKKYMEGASADGSKD